ncbi:MAG: replication initiator protein [Microvirus sp.]|nr:MAG: replication initiator protein [Microvirus sp.]
MKCINPTLKAEIGKRTIFRSFNLASNIVKKIGIPFNCGKCIACRKRNAKELARRCVLHASLYENNCFVTLTYDESAIGNNTLDYTDIQKFKKRLRKSLNGKKIEIFNVHEYGKQGRKHWHLVIFNHDFSDKTLYTTNNSIPIYTSEELQRLWPFGYNTVGDVNEASAMYQAQYTQKDIINGNDNNAKKAKSNHSGIGKPYFNKHWKQLLSLGYVPINNEKMPLPRYFEKLAHKHYCHYYDQSAFFDTKDRKALYRPFKKESPNIEIANLFITYKKNKLQYIEEKAEEWEQIINKHTSENSSPDFVKSGENFLREEKLKRLTKKEKF